MEYKSKLIREFWENGKVPGCPVYDMHCHMGNWSYSYTPYNSPEQMILRMDRAGVKMIAFCHFSALLSPDTANRDNVETVKRFPDRMRAYCGINPNYPQQVEKELETFDSYKGIYVGFKFLADYHCVPITDERYSPVWEYADREQLLLLIHTWNSSMYDGDHLVRKIAEKYHKVKIILGHSCHDRWDEAAEMAKNYSNIYLELCAVTDERSGILEKFVSVAGSRKVLFGTDFPLYNHHYYIGGVLAADITDQDRRNIFYLNAEKLLSPLL